MTLRHAAKPPKGPIDKEVFYKRLADKGATLALNPWILKSREQALKDTYALFAAKVLAVAGKLPNGREVRNYSSGNYPLCFPDQKVDPIMEAILANVQDRKMGGYRVGEMAAKERIGAYYGAPADAVFFTNGISGAIQTIHRVFLFNGGAVLTPNECYPTHLSTAITFGGPQKIVVTPRHPYTRQPDFSEFDYDNNPFSKATISTFVTHENPNPIIHDPQVYRNDEGTGVFDLNERAAWKDDVVRPVGIDKIYGSFCWPPPEKGLTPKQIIELSGDKNVLIFYDSISKSALEPGMRAGVVVVYVPPAMVGTVPAASQLIADLGSEDDRLLCGSGRPGVAGLVAYHDLLAQDAHSPHPAFESIRIVARERFLGNGLDKPGNQATMCAVKGISPLHPGVELHSSGYNLFKVDGDDLPWARTEYKNRIIGKLRSEIEKIPDDAVKIRALAVFNDYLTRIPPAEIAASDIFCLDLFLETGVIYAPFERFYKLGTAPADTVAFRAVMIASEEEFSKAAKLLEEFIELRLN